MKNIKDYENYMGILIIPYAKTVLKLLLLETLKNKHTYKLNLSLEKRCKCHVYLSVSMHFQ